MNRKKNASTVLVYGVLIFITLICLFPIVWMCLISIKSTSESITGFNSLMVSNPTMANFKRLFEMIPVGQNAFNSVFTTIMGTITSLFFCALAGFAFAKLRFKGKNLLFSIVLVQMMLPSQIFIIPQYQMLAKMGLTNTMFALVFPGLVSAFGTFFLRQSYMGIPDEIGEAACLDGCSQWQTFTKVMMPLTKASMAALTIFTAVFAYGDLMWPLIANTDLGKMTLSAGLSTLRGQFTTNYPVLMAGSMLAMIPMIILYLLFQKQFIEGIAMTGGK